MKGNARPSTPQLQVTDRDAAAPALIGCGPEGRSYKSCRSEARERLGFMLGKPPPPPRGPQQPSQGRPPNPKPSSHAEPSPHLLWLLAVSQLGQAQPQRNPMLRQGLEDRQVPISHARVVVPGTRAAFRTAQRLDPPPGAGGVGLLRQQGTGKTTKTSLSAPLVSAPSVGPLIPHPAVISGACEAVLYHQWLPGMRTASCSGQPSNTPRAADRTSSACLASISEYH